MSILAPFNKAQVGEKYNKSAIGRKAKLTEFANLNPKNRVIVL